MEVIKQINLFVEEEKKVSAGNEQEKSVSKWQGGKNISNQGLKFFNLILSKCINDK